MTASLTTLTIKDGAGTSRDMRALDESGTGVGPYSFLGTFHDGISGLLIRYEDQASANADPGIVTLVKRNDSPGNTSATDGDYEPLQVSAGRLWTSATITAVVPGTGATALGKAEDAAHSSGDTGVMALSVRKDTAAATADTDADYQPLITDSSGRLHTRVGAIDAGSNVIGKVSVDQTTPGTTNKIYITDINKGDYETVAASQTDQALGASGATGDYLAGVLIVPASTSPGAVSIKDGAGSAITIFTGGGSSVSNLVPFFVPLGIKSGAGAWKVTTGSNVSAIGVGSFT